MACAEKCHPSSKDDTPCPHYRLHLPEIPQYVTQRDNNRQLCFYAAEDYRFYLELLQAACRNHAGALHAYILMTNHVHLLLTPENADSISLVIREVGRDYVRTVSRTYRRTGTLWEGRYKSSLVDKGHYCLACYRYIELNPVRIGMVRHPEDYPWSSYRCNATGEANSLITPHNCWPELGNDDYERTATYRELINERMLQADLEHIRKSLDTVLPTGNDRFRQEIEHTLAVKLGTGRRGRPRKSTE